ncbi:hypothetical protein M9H77_31414 [Catharanthus roseus]|uniref:Uncharacterized protein n=1 Tax=Catharanthus roseus TaxID=4058 RepID=A0ACC0A2P5_CATRO|nr:hypothetical protein M9H77_31414 [Catharanthus roseus]
MNPSIFLILLNGLGLKNYINSEAFYDLTTLFSGGTYPTSILYFSNVRKIQQLIEKNLTNENEDVKNMTTFISQIFKQYWDCYSIVLSFASSWNLRYKISHVKAVFRYLDSNTTKAKVKNVRDKLYSLFDEYMQFAPNPCLHTFNIRGNLNDSDTGYENEDDEDEGISIDSQSWVARLYIF